MASFFPQYLIKVATLLVLFSLSQEVAAQSQKMMWVLASFASADLAAKEADRVYEMTGQTTAVQVARVGQAIRHRVLIVPATDSGSEARLTSLLRSISYEQTWRVWLGEAEANSVSWYGIQPADSPDQLNTFISEQSSHSDETPLIANLDDLLEGQSVEVTSPSSQIDDVKSSGQGVDLLLAPDVEYHPIRLRAPL